MTMIAEAPPLVSDATAWLILASSCAAVVGLVFGTCWKVVRWIDRQEARYEAVDTVVADWHERGLTPAGAVAEGKRLRDTVSTHTAAISDHERRLDGQDERIGENEVRIDHLVGRVDEIAVQVRRP